MKFIHRWIFFITFYLEFCKYKTKTLITGWTSSSKNWDVFHRCQFGLGMVTAANTLQFFLQFETLVSAACCTPFHFAFPVAQLYVEEINSCNWNRHLISNALRFEKARTLYDKFTVTQIKFSVHNSWYLMHMERLIHLLHKKVCDARFTKNCKQIFLSTLFCQKKSFLFWRNVRHFIIINLYDVSL